MDVAEIFTSYSFLRPGMTNNKYYMSAIEWH